MSDQVLRRRLAERLWSSGDLRSPEWRRAVETVPRHLFVPEFFRRLSTPRGTMWEPVTPATVSEDERLRLAYQDETWVTQIDGGIHPGDVREPIHAGSLTSSSTLPGLVVAMLEDLDVHTGSDVLEIGTGTGYSTALLCERLGAEHVVSVETDPGLAARAARNLHQAGYTPTLITGDGLAGCAAHAPYDRIIATCSVRSIPPAWIVQGRPGATVLTTLSGWLYGSAYAKVEVNADETATGRFLPETYSFMMARSQQPPPTEIHETQPVDSARPRPATVPPDALDDPTALFIAQLAAPRAQHGGRSMNSGPAVDYYADQETGSVSAVTRHDDDTWSVQETGPTPPWDLIETALTEWRNAGSPALEHFRIDITSHEQRVFVPGHDALAWRLPC
ncbi:hypothetical protein DPM19_27785 [Actinomadura craniellae]|uniref:Protein-L-isoaspartate O-methyltransferase n=1 Tax=Actinomadura craniellae TaxID=2231787 RepID=A0A365GY83_9ACTN|nr:ATP-grasp peptide maturase system methyltransferase [Actinomadura craniellae]RAY11789.1 hypothetical protein DPM19_27785 [Actinomadura craniellae]